MNTFFTIVVVVQVLSALTIIGLVLLQHGKGADMGAAFGSGASGSLFGATGSSNFLSKSTGVAAAVFFMATLALSYLSSNRHVAVGAGIMDNVSRVPVKTSAAIPASLSTKTVANPGSSTPGANTQSAVTTASPKPVTPAGQSNEIPK
jgi:preprotein translocase subunit SecG